MRAPDELRALVERELDSISFSTELAGPAPLEEILALGRED